MKGDNMANLYKKGRNFSAFFIILFIALLVNGCDRLPFLSSLFPTKPKTETKEISQPEVKGTLLARVDNWVLTLEDFNQKVEALRKLSPEFKIETLD